MRRNKRSEARIELFKRGYTMSSETRRKISESKKGNKNGFKKGHKLGIGRKFSDIAKAKMSLAKRGSKSPNWKGGVTPLKEEIRHSFKYRQWRSDIYTRDDFTCRMCLLRGGSLHPHHIKEFHRILEEYKIKTLEQAFACEELWNINNGLTLCVPCHKNLHKRKYENHFLAVDKLPKKTQIKA